MHKFTEGYYYYFKSMHDHILFTERCSDNRVFANFVGTHPFKVIEVDDYGNAQRVMNHNGETDFVHLDAVDELTYFNIAFDKAWCVEAGYQLKDAKGFFANSSINRNFIEVIGHNPFIVDSVVLGVHDLKTTRLRYIDPEDRSKVCYFNFTLTESELSYFEEWKRPICSGFTRGLDIVNKMHRVPEVEESETEDPDIGIVEVEPETRKVEVKGKIHFVVEDEITRLKAIEMLTNMVFR